MKTRPMNDAELLVLAQSSKVSTNMVLDGYRFFLKETGDTKEAIKLTDIWWRGIMSTGGKGDIKECM